MKVRKIVLCTLPADGDAYFFSSPPYFLKEAVNYPPLGLLYLAAQIKDREVKLIDAAAEKLSIDQTVERILLEHPDLLGFTAYTVRAYALKTICEKVKEKSGEDIRIVAGGNHASLYPKETLRYRGIDYVMQGECDYTFPRLLEAIDNGEKVSELSEISGLSYYDKNKKMISGVFTEPKFSLDDLPFPERRLINPNLYSTLAQDTFNMTTMVSSRGCPFKCNYCDIQIKKLRFRSPENVFAEIEQIVASGINEISFFDDCFNVDRRRVVQICNLIIKNKLKIKWSCRLRVYPFDEEMGELIATSGCNRLHFGVESVNDEILRYAQKGITFAQSKEAIRICRKYKIKTLIYLMFGFPQETLTDLRKAQEIIINELRPDYIFPSILGPYPGAKFYYELLEKGSLKEDFWGKFMRDPEKDFKVPSFRTPEQERMVIDFINNLNRKFYFSPRFILDNLGKITRKENLGRCIKIGLGMLFWSNSNNEKT
jgi:anaerobic magnesium-protoporphyrin IX monomethyl ester cyclase